MKDTTCRNTPSCCTRWAREGFARCAVSHRSWNARRRRRGEAQGQPLQVRRKTTETGQSRQSRRSQEVKLFMSRRRQANKRPLTEDAKFHSPLVSRLVNTVMKGGNKSVAQRIVYGAFDQIGTKNPTGNPLEILQRAVENAKPRLEVKARRVGGATYQVPSEASSDRQMTLAIRWLVDFADARKGISMRKRWRRKSWMPIKGRETPFANAMKCIRWRRRTRPLPISAGS